MCVRSKQAADKQMAGKQHQSAAGQDGDITSSERQSAAIMRKLSESSRKGSITECQKRKRTPKGSEEVEVEKTVGCSKAHCSLYSASLLPLSIPLHLCNVFCFLSGNFLNSLLSDSLPTLSYVILIYNGNNQHSTGRNCTLLVSACRQLPSK